MKYLVIHPHFRPSEYLFTFKKGNKEMVHCRFTNITPPRFGDMPTHNEKDFPLTDVKLKRVKSKIEKFFIRLYTDLKNRRKWNKQH